MLACLARLLGIAGSEEGVKVERGSVVIWCFGALLRDRAAAKKKLTEFDASSKL